MWRRWLSIPSGRRIARSSTRQRIWPASHRSDVKNRHLRQLTGSCTRARSQEQWRSHRRASVQNWIHQKRRYLIWPVMKGNQKSKCSTTLCSPNFRLARPHRRSREKFLAWTEYFHRITTAKQKSMTCVHQEPVRTVSSTSLLTVKSLGLLRRISADQQPVIILRCVPHKWRLLIRRWTCHRGREETWSITASREGLSGRDPWQMKLASAKLYNKRRLIEIWE